MTRIFLEIFNLSIAACWLIAAVLVLRAVFAKRMPKWISCCLWGLVALRLLVPFTFESSISLVPNERIVISDIKQGQGSASTDAEISVSSGKEDEGGISPEGSDIYFGQEESGIVTDNSPQQPESDSSVQMNGYAPIINADDFSAPEPSGSIALNTDNGADLGGNTGIDDKESGISAKTAKILSSVWLCGVAAMLLYSLISFVALKRRVMLSIPCGDMVRKGECVESPFVFGLLKPRIYLPFGLSAQTEQCVIAHERAHLKRRDHLIKPLGFLLLSVYWFNPLVWVAYILLCRDIEFACDEKVISTLAPEERKTYAYALLECAVAHRRISACPVAFGETGVKERVKNTMKYRRPALWIIIASILVCALVTAPFITTSATEIEEDSKASEGFEVSQDSVEESIEESFEESLEASTDESFEEGLEASTEESFEESISEESIPEESIPEVSEPEESVDEGGEQPNQSAPVPLGTLGNKHGNSRIAKQGSTYYYAEGSYITAITDNGNASRRVLQLSSGYIYNLNIVGDWMYFSVEAGDVERGYIAKVRTDGSGFTKLLQIGNIFELLVVNERIYFIPGCTNIYEKLYDGGLYSMSVNGGTVTEIHSGWVSSLCADENYIYFIYENIFVPMPTNIYRINHDGSGKRFIWEAENDINVNSIAVDSSRVYFGVFDEIELGKFKFVSIDNNGNGYTEYGAIENYSYMIDVSDGKLYYYGHDFYYGEMPTWGEPDPITNEVTLYNWGLIEMDLATNELTYLHVNAYESVFYADNGLVFVPENYSVAVINTETGETKKISVK
ncbi:MAG: DUF5050 domain-containing protein [Clostridia bacterium]|nr:DUF5050 domain-containing protein [Clostridia bacterium]